MPGPPRTPTPILLARGSRWPQRRGASAEVAFDRKRPTCPSWLKGEARAEWKRQIKELEQAGVLQKVDRALLASYCCSWGEFHRLAALPPDDADWRRAVQMDRCQKRLVQLAQQFGFSPSARTRVTAGEAEGKAEEGSILGFARKRDAKSRFFRDSQENKALGQDRRP